jgi:hypothetical protein
VSSSRPQELDRGWNEEHHELEAEPEPIPESWASMGMDSPTHGDALFLATAYAPAARSFEPVFDSISYAPDEIKVVSVLYVRRDAHRAFVRTYRRERRGGGVVPHPDTFASGIARPPNYGDHVPEGSERRREYAAVLNDLYGIELPELSRLEAGGADA